MSAAAYYKPNSKVKKALRRKLGIYLFIYGHSWHVFRPLLASAVPSCHMSQLPFLIYATFKIHNFHICQTQTCKSLRKYSIVSFNPKNMCISQH